MYTEITPRNLLSIACRQQRKFWLVFFVIVAGGVGYAFLAQPVYEAGGTLLVKFGDNAAPELNERPESRTELSQNDRREIMQSDIEILQSHDLLAAVVREVRPDSIYPGITEKVSGIDSPVEAAIRKIQKHDLIVKSGQQSDVIDLRLFNPDPTLAAFMVKRLFDGFIARQSEMYDNPQSAFLLEQMRMAAEKLDASQARLQAFKANQGVSSLDEELSNLQREKADAETIALQAIDDAETRLSNLEAKNTELLTTYRADSWQAQSLRRSINEARAQLLARQADFKKHTDRGAAPGSPNVLAAHVAAIDRRIAELENLRAQYNALTRQVQIDEELAHSFKIKSEQARVGQTLNEQKITHISVVDAPMASVRPARPRRLLTVAISLIAGGVFGCLAAFGFEWFDDRYTIPEQLAASLRLPVLASFTAART